VLVRTGAGAEMPPAREAPETEPTLAVKLRALALEGVRLCRTGW
jgi:hypothetical protein